MASRTTPQTGSKRRVRSLARTGAISALALVAFGNAAGQALAMPSVPVGHAGIRAFCVSCDAPADSLPISSDPSSFDPGVDSSMPDPSVDSTPSSMPTDLPSDTGPVDSMPADGMPVDSMPTDSVPSDTGTDPSIPAGSRPIQLPVCPANIPLCETAGDLPVPPPATKPTDTPPVQPKPADPVTPKPADPVTPKPADPVTPKPADPVTPKPADPVTPKPADPVTPKPADADPAKPADPVTPKPAQPAGPSQAAVDWVNQQIQTGSASGQCTAWAIQKRPDLFRAVDTPTYDAWAKTGFDPAQRPAQLLNGPAANMTATARNAGLPVGKVPHVGDLMVEQPGTTMPNTAGGTNFADPVSGHVAYVESVQTDAAGNPVSFTVSEMHAPELGVVTTRTVPIAGAGVNGVDFIS